MNWRTILCLGLFAIVAPPLLAQGDGPPRRDPTRDRIIRPIQPPENPGRIDRPQDPRTDRREARARALAPGSDATERMPRRPDEPVTVLWKMWWQRNHTDFQATPSIPETGRQHRYEPHVTDPQWRAEKLASLRPRLAVPLAQLLGDADARIRGAAAIALARVGATGNGAAIQSALGDPDPRVRDRALLAQALSSELRYDGFRFAHGDCDSAPRALQEDGLERIRSFAALFLAEAGEQRLAPLVQDFVRDPAVALRHRAVAVRALGRSGDTSCSELLLSLAADERAPTTVRCAAVAALADLGVSSVALPLLTLAERSRTPSDLRLAAALASGGVITWADSVAIRRLLHLTRTASHQTLRDFALLAAGQVGGDLIEATLRKIVTEERGAARCVAMVALGLACRDAQSALGLDRLLQAAAQDRNVEHRAAALAALGVSGQARALDVLHAALRDEPSPELRRIAAQAIGLHARPDSSPRLAQALASETAPEVSIAIAAALGQSDPGAYDALLRCFRQAGQSTTERRALITAIGRTHDPRAAETLLEYGCDPRVASVEREAAIEALGVLFQPGTTPALAWLGHASNFYRESPEVPYLLALSE